MTTTLSAPALGVRRKRAFSWTRAAYVVHSFIGLKLTIFMIVVLLSGTLAVLSQEIDWVLYPETRATPQEERVPISTLYEAFREAYPGHGIVDFSTGRLIDYKAASIGMTRPDGAFRVVWINPYTGAVQGETPIFTAGTFLSFLHTRLFIPNIGRSFVNFFGPLMVVMMITGLVTYKKFWKGFLKAPRTNNARTFMGDMHRLLAMWSIWFVMIMGVTGTWWFYDDPIVEYTRIQPPIKYVDIRDELTRSEQRRLRGERPEKLTLDEAVRIAQDHIPGLVIVGVELPENNISSYVLRGHVDEVMTRGTMTQVSINPYTGDIIEARLGTDYPLVTRLDEAMHPLHYGTLGGKGASGLILKLVWFVFGLFLTFLAVSGLVIYTKRTGKALGVKPGVGRRVWRWVKPWGGPMGGLKYLNVALVAVMLLGMTVAFRITGDGASSAGGYAFAEKRFGPWALSFQAVAGLLEADQEPFRPRRDVLILPTYCEGCFEEIKLITASVGVGLHGRTGGAPVNGEPGLAIAAPEVPRNLSDAHRLWVRVETWDGKTYFNNWPLRPDGIETVDRRRLVQN